MFDLSRVPERSASPVLSLGSNHSATSIPRSLIVIVVRMQRIMMKRLMLVVIVFLVRMTTLMTTRLMMMEIVFLVKIVDLV